MGENIIAAALGLAGVLVGTVSSSSLIAWRIKALEGKVDRLNTLVERVAVQERDLKTAFSRIDETRADIKDLQRAVRLKPSGAEGDS